VLATQNQSQHSKTCNGKENFLHINAFLKDNTAERQKRYSLHNSKQCKLWHIKLHI